MDAQMLTQLLQSNHALTRDEATQIMAARDIYPYCALLHAMVFQAKRMFGDANAEASDAVLRMHDAQRLETPIFSTVANQAATPIDVLKEINEYHEVSFKTAPKSVILSHFLDTSGYHISSDEPEPTESIEDLGRISQQRDDDICTETLARILTLQGKIAEAIDVYNKLIVKYPEKNATFAAAIAELKLQQ